jgi:hypothetical protein
MRFQVQAHFVCLHEVMIPKSGIRFSEKIMTKQKIVQQHSGDWAMAGKVPVARVEGQAPLPATIGRMKVIRHIKTMAGSPDADLALRSASRNLAHGFVCRAFTPFMNP